jgi:hypothetical protein
VLALAAAKALHAAGGSSLLATSPFLVTATSLLEVRDSGLPLARSRLAAAEASGVVETG